jgi:hypothetical protein
VSGALRATGSGNGVSLSTSSASATGVAQTTTKMVGTIHCVSKVIAQNHSIFDEDIYKSLNPESTGLHEHKHTKSLVSNRIDVYSPSSDGMTRTDNISVREDKIGLTKLVNKHLRVTNPRKNITINR